MAIPITAIPTFFTSATFNTTVYAAVVREADHSEAADHAPAKDNHQAVDLVLAVEAEAGFPPEVVVVAEAFGDAHTRCATLVCLSNDKHASRDVISPGNGL